MQDKLSRKAKDEVFFELIFMTYSYVHRMINKEAFPNAIDLYNQDKMTGRGMGKYMYKKEEKEYAKEVLVDKLKKKFKKNKIWYIV